MSNLPHDYSNRLEAQSIELAQLRRRNAELEKENEKLRERYNRVRVDIEQNALKRGYEQALKEMGE